jgi:hypothetical protein
MAAASLFGIAAPALAAGTSAQLSDTNVNPSTINPNQQVTISFSVKDTGDAGQITVEVNSSNPKVTCVGSCKNTAVTFMANETKQYSFKFAATGSFSGPDNATLQIKATPLGNGAGQPATDNNETVNINAPTQTQAATVPEVSGTVVDVFTGVPIDAATVSIQDSANPPHTYSVGTDKNGVYKFTSTPDKPIVAGTIAFAVDKTGLQTFPGATRQANPGQALTGVKLSVAPVNSTVTPSNQQQQTTNAQNTATLPPDETRQVADSGGGSGGLSWVLIAIGGVLVLLGIGAIVLLLVRRNGAGGDDDGSDDPNRPGPRGGSGGPGRGGRGGQGRGGPGGGAGGPGPRQGGPGGPMRGSGGGGGYDPTRPLRSPASPGPRAEQTVIAPSPLAGGQPRGGRPGQGGPGPNGYGQQGGQGGYTPQQGQYGGEHQGGYDPYANQQDSYGQPGYGGGPRPGPGPQSDGRRIEWTDD